MGGGGGGHPPLPRHLGAERPLDWLQQWERGSLMGARQPEDGERDLNGARCEQAGLTVSLGIVGSRRTLWSTGRSCRPSRRLLQLALGHCPLSRLAPARVQSRLSDHERCRKSAQALQACAGTTARQRRAGGAWRFRAVSFAALPALPACLCRIAPRDHDAKLQVGSVNWQVIACRGVPKGGSADGVSRHGGGLAAAGVSLCSWPPRRPPPPACPPGWTAGWAWSRGR